MFTSLMNTSCSLTVAWIQGIKHTNGYFYIMSNLSYTVVERWDTPQKNISSFHENMSIFHGMEGLPNEMEGFISKSKHFFLLNFLRFKCIGMGGGFILRECMILISKILCEVHCCPIKRVRVKHMERYLAFERSLANKGSACTCHLRFSRNFQDLKIVSGME